MSAHIYPPGTRGVLAERHLHHGVLRHGTRLTIIAITRRDDGTMAVVRRWGRNHQVAATTRSPAVAVGAANALMGEYLDGGWIANEGPFTMAGIPAMVPPVAPRPLIEELFG